MKKKSIYLLISLLSFNKLAAQKPFISPFADSTAVAALYNPFKIDTIIADPTLLQLGWYEEVVSLEKLGHYEKAYKIFDNKITDPLGMYLLGKYNYHGLGIPKNPENAFSWFQKSSGLEFTYGLESLSKMYLFGETRKANDSIALILLKKSFENGSQLAASKIGYIFQKGNIVKRNIDSASFWYRKIINLNDKYATYNMAVIDESKKDIESTIAGYKKAAEANIDVASQRLGEIYFKGIGLKPDLDKAKVWCKRGCEQSNGSACNFLGLIYINQKDSTKAFLSFQKGNLLKDTQSSFNLALCYSEGVGVKRDEDQAFAIYGAVADISSQAQNNIGTLYERNLIGKNDIPEAVKWYEKSAEKKNVLAMLNVGKLYELGGENLKIDTAKAKSFYEKAALSGNKKGMYMLARLQRHSDILKAIDWAEKLAKTENLDGMRLAGDLNRQRADMINSKVDNKSSNESKIKESTKIVLYNKALNWYENAAKKGDDSSMVRLGQLYYVGKLIKKDHVKAKFWWKKAADKGNATANYNLAYLYEKGLDSKEENINYKSAVEYYKEVVENKNVKLDLKKDAAFKLGYLHQYTDVKKGLGQDSREALKWFKIAADLNDADAMYEIGAIYENGGINVPVSKEEAVKWYKKSISLGNVEAKKPYLRLKENKI